MTVIDAHQHFYDPDRGDHPWLREPRFAPVRRLFGPQDLQPELDRNGVSGTVLVQTWSSRQETEEFLALATTTPSVLGVIGWVDLTASDVAEQIARLRAGPGGSYLVGIRHQVHDEADDGWLLRDDVGRGLAAVDAAGLVYDLLIRPRHLRASMIIADRYPNLRLVIDHIAKPDMSSDEDVRWSGAMADIPTRPNVFCKASGLVTEADWSSWDPEHLGTFVLKVLDWFGAERVLFGSDWPVCLVAGSYGEVLSIVAAAAAERGPRTVAAVMGGTAVRCYGLQVPTTVRSVERRGKHDG